jgi:hypothetical protein
MNKGTFVAAAFSFAIAALVPLVSNKICSLTALLVHKKGFSIIIMRIDI